MHARGKAWAAGQAGRVSPCSRECDQIFVVDCGTAFRPDSRALGLRMAEPGPLSVGQPMHGTYGPRGASTLEPGIRGALEVHVHHEIVFSLDDCADIQSLPGCPVTVLTLNGPARPVPRPHEVEPQCYRAPVKAKRCRAGARWLPCRGAAIYYCRPSLFRELHGDIDRHIKVLCRAAGRKSRQGGTHHISRAG